MYIYGIIKTIYGIKVSNGVNLSFIIKNTPENVNNILIIQTMLFWVLYSLPLKLY